MIEEGFRFCQDHWERDLVWVPIAKSPLCTLCIRFWNLIVKCANVLVLHVVSSLKNLIKNFFYKGLAA